MNGPLMFRLLIQLSFKQQNRTKRPCLNYHVYLHQHVSLDYLGYIALYFCVQITMSTQITMSVQITQSIFRLLIQLSFKQQNRTKRLCLNYHVYLHQHVSLDYHVKIQEHVSLDILGNIAFHFYYLLKNKAAPKYQVKLEHHMVLITMFTQTLSAFKTLSGYKSMSAYVLISSCTSKQMNISA